MPVELFGFSQDNVNPVFDRRDQCFGNFEIIFGVSSLDDPAVGVIERLRTEFPECAIRLVECRERLGTSGKVSNLVQMLRDARYDHVIINDSDADTGA